MTSFLRQASVGFKKIVPSVVFLTLLSMFALPLSQSHATSFTNGLVGHWKLDETSGTTAVDSSGSGNNGTLTNGPTISTDHATTIFSNARALSFDGSNDKVLYGNVLGSVFQGDYTVSLWVKSETTSFGRLIGKADYVNGDSPFSVLFNYPSTGKINLYVGTNADVNALASVSADLNNGHWRHLTFQRIGTVQNIFVDGVLDATVTRSTSPGTNSSQLTIGHDGSGDGLETQQFGGNIDDVRVYNRALSPEEISVLAAEKSLVGYWKFDETNGTSVADSSGMGNTGTHTNSPTISTDVPDDINFTDGRSLSFDGTDTYVDLGNNPSLNLSGGEATFTFWIKPTALSSYYQSIIEKRDAGLSGQEYEVFFDTNGKLGFYNGTVFTSTYTLNTNIWTHVAVSVSDSDTCTFYANGVSVYSIGSCFIGPTSSANAIIGYFNGGALDLQPFNGLLDDIRIYNRALSSTEITALAAGNHPPATWTGEHSTYYEDPNNWNTGVVPDPYSNVTIANAGARPVLTDAVSLSDLTINSSASLDLKDKNLTQLDGGTFSNNGTLVLDGSQTLTNFTNDTNSGQEIIRSSSNLTSFAPGDSYYNLRIEDPTENGLVGYWKLDEGSGSLTTDLSGNGNNGTLVNGAAFSTSTGSTNFYNPGSLSFDGANDYVSIANDGSFEFNSHDFSFSSWVRFNTLGFAIATINGSGYSGWEVARYGNVLSFFNGGTWAYSTQDFTQGQWAHIAVINNGTNTSFFFNGEAVGVVAQGRPNNSGNAPLRLASRSDANYSNVILDDVRIYNRALSAKEVANLAKGRYAAGASSTATHPPDAPARC